MLRTLKQIVVGTHRQTPIGETLKRLLPLLEQFEITRVASITGLDDVGIPTVVVARPNARSLSVSQGKGLSLEAAKVSGIMEAIEQFHAEHSNLPLRLGSYCDRSRRAKVVDPMRWPHYARQWDPDARILWTQATAWRGGGGVEVPFELVHLDLTLPLPLGSGFFPIGSNGLASGNGLMEAILHGACELIERDATALFYCLTPAQQAARRIRLDSIDDADVRALLQKFERASVGVAVWDITSDLGIAAFLCSTVERELNAFRPVGLARGFGCNLDRSVALSRALCEAAQSRLTRIAGSRDDFQRDDVALVSKRDSILRHQRQLAEETTAERCFQAVPTHRFDYFEDDLAFIETALEHAGIGPLLHVELTEPGLPLAVARVLAPGLEGSADVPGYVPGTRARAIKATSAP